MFENDLRRLSLDGRNYIGCPSQPRPGCTARKSSARMSEQSYAFARTLELCHFSLVRFISGLGDLHQRYHLVRTSAHENEVWFFPGASPIAARDWQFENAVRNGFL